MTRFNRRQFLEATAAGIAIALQGELPLVAWMNCSE
jgi:hypothetical protein